MKNNFTKYLLLLALFAVMMDGKAQLSTSVCLPWNNGWTSNISESTEGNITIYEEFVIDDNPDNCITSQSGSIYKLLPPENSNKNVVTIKIKKQRRKSGIYLVNRYEWIDRTIENTILFYITITFYKPISTQFNAVFFNGNDKISVCEGEQGGIVKPEYLLSSDYARQWYLNNQPIAGATNDRYDIGGVNGQFKVSDAGSYVLKIKAPQSYCTWQDHSISSSAATLSLTQKATIDRSSLRDLIACEGTSQTLSLSVSGSPPISYQWYFKKTGENTFAQLGQTEVFPNNPTNQYAHETQYDFPNLTTDNNGEYYAKVLGQCEKDDWSRAIISPSANVIVLTKTKIVDSDIIIKDKNGNKAESICFGNDYSMSVSVTGTSPSFEWLRYGRAGTMGSQFIGTLGSNYSVSNPFSYGDINSIFSTYGLVRNTLYYGTVVNDLRSSSSVSVSSTMKINSITEDDLTWKYKVTVKGVCDATEKVVFKSFPEPLALNIPFKDFPFDEKAKSYQKIVCTDYAPDLLNQYLPETITDQALEVKGGAWVSDFNDASNGLSRSQNLTDYYFQANETNEKHNQGDNALTYTKLLSNGCVAKGTLHYLVYSNGSEIEAKKGFEDDNTQYFCVGSDVDVTPTVTGIYGGNPINAFYAFVNDKTLDHGKLLKENLQQYYYTVDTTTVQTIYVRGKNTVGCFSPPVKMVIKTPFIGGAIDFYHVKDKNSSSLNAAVGELLHFGYSGIKLDKNSYTWDFDDDTEISIVDEKKHSFSAPKTYNVKLTVKVYEGGGCSKDFFLPIDVSGSNYYRSIVVTALHEDKEAFFAYPNPASEQIRISRGEIIGVSNALGSRMPCNCYGKEMSVAHFSEGIYFLETTQGTVKFLVKK